MASKPVQDNGYHDARFEVDITESFHCPICLNVLREPKMCRFNEHLFCHACIAEHLHNSSTCPQCMEELTPETLLRPSKSFMRCYSELRINCDYSDRGCPKYVELGDINIHTKSCGFAPTKCSNEACSMLVDKRDKLYHEAELCQYRKREKCYDCQKKKGKNDDLPKKGEELAKTENKQPKSKPVTNEVNGCKQDSSIGPHTQDQEKQNCKQVASYYNESDNSVDQYDGQDDHDYDEQNYHVDDYNEPDDHVEDYDGPDDISDDYDEPENFLEDYDGPDDIIGDYGDPDDITVYYGGPDDIVDDTDEPDNIVDDYDERDNFVDDYDEPDDIVDDYDERGNFVDENDEPDNIVDDDDEHDNIVDDYDEPDNIVDDDDEPDNIVDDDDEPDNIVDDYDEPDNIVDDDDEPDNIVDDDDEPDNIVDDYDEPDNIVNDYDELDNFTDDYDEPDNFVDDYDGPDEYDYYY